MLPPRPLAGLRALLLLSLVAPSLAVAGGWYGPWGVPEPGEEADGCPDCEGPGPSPLLRDGTLPTAAEGPAGAPAAADKPAVAWDVNAAHGPGKDVDFTVSTGTWMGLDVSPDGQSILFDLLGDIYVLPVAGGVAQPLTRGVAWDTDAHWSADGKTIAYTSDAGGNEELWTMAADGSGATRITREDVDRYSDPVWSPEPGWFLARRRSVDTRSIGVQELWMLHQAGGKGVRITSLDADPHAGEAAFSPDGRYIWFSTRSGRFEYNHNPHQGLWQIARYDRKLGERVTVTDIPGSASRPTPSPDGRTLAFLTRDRERTVLSLLDLTTGRVHALTDALDPDGMESFELHGTYPRMDWTPDGKALIYTASGTFWRLDVATGARTAIPFTANVKTRITDAVHPERRLGDDPVHARILRWPTVASDGTVYVAGVGRIWAIDGVGKATAVTPAAMTAYFPSLSPDQKQLAYTTWSDAAGGQVWLQAAGAKGGKARQVTVTGADYQSPAVSPDGKDILFLRGSDATARGHDLGAEAFYDLRITSLGKGADGDGVRVRSIPFRGSNQPAPRPQWSPDGTRIYWLEDVPPAGRVPETAALVSCKRDGTDLRTHVTFDGAQEVRLSADGRSLLVRKGFQAYVAALPTLDAVAVAFDALPSRKLTEEAGDWVDWVNPHTVSWSHGDQLYTLDLASGVYDREAKSPPAAIARTLKVEVPSFVGKGLIAFTNARIVPVEGQPIAKGTLVVDGRRIVAVGADVAVPAGAKVIDVGGKTILPGIVDVHAHLHYASGDVFPEQEWRHLVNLSYGVTTVFDPSASSDLVFGQGELVASGRMAGPRVLSTGYILYGALDNLGAKIESPEDAERHVQRLKDLGAWGIKSYQQSHRSARQWLVEACRKLGMLDVPEGGGDLFQNIGMMLDGHSSNEHALPVAPLYDDVIQLWSRSKTAYTPTLLVAYGGLFGEVEQYQNEKVWADARLSRFTPAEVLTSRAFRLDPYVSDPNEFRHHLTEQSAAKMQAAGVWVTLGAHGQLQGLGPHWELEMLGGPNAMAPAAAIEASTLTGAKHLGLDHDIGSLVPGKIADLYIVDGDPLARLSDARNVVWVMKDGILYDAATMNRVSPDPATRAPMIWEAAKP